MPSVRKGRQHGSSEHGAAKSAHPANKAGTVHPQGATLNLERQNGFRIAKIAIAMKAHSLPEPFVSQSMALALQNEGAFDLMELWLESSSEQNRGEIIADLQDLLDDYAETPTGPVIKPKVEFKDLDRVVSQIIEHKDRLR